MLFWKKWFVPKPFNEGYLPELDGHEVYFAEYGNPQGEVILTFHGGPGYWSRAENAKNFDLRKYRVVMFDQRGSGKSKPLGATENNTTQDLLDDAVRLLDYLKIEGGIILYGSSWGSTLVLLFAEQYPETVKCLLLSKIFLADRDCREWELKDSGRFYPDILDAIKGDLPDNSQIPGYYDKMINSGDKALQSKAVSLYGSYERQLGRLNPKIEILEADERSLAANRIYMHYSAEEFMLAEDEIMDNIGKIHHIPTLIVHNRLDFVCPPSNAYKFHKAMQNSKLVIVPDKGHSSKMLSAVNKKEMAEFLKNV